MIVLFLSLGVYCSMVHSVDMDMDLVKYSRRRYSSVR